MGKVLLHLDNKYVHMTLKELIIINKQVSLIRLERFGDSAVVFSLTNTRRQKYAGTYDRLEVSSPAGRLVVGYKHVF